MKPGTMRGRVWVVSVGDSRSCFGARGLQSRYSYGRTFDLILRIGYPSMKEERSSNRYQILTGEFVMIAASRFTGDTMYHRMIRTF